MCTVIATKGDTKRSLILRLIVRQKAEPCTMAPEILCKWMWRLFSFIFTLIQTAIAKILLGIECYSKSEQPIARRASTSRADNKLCRNRCVGSNSKGTGFSDGENSASDYTGNVHKNTVDTARESVIRKLKTRTAKTGSRKQKTLNGPSGLPFLGCLHLLGGPGGPFQAFTEMSRKYGEIYTLKLGSFRCVVVSSYRLIKEVLVTRGKDFGGRPNFLRFHELFGGDRNNSLALCDWSELQKTRRALARSYCSPRSGSAQQGDIDRVASIETNRLIDVLGADEAISVRRGEEPLKPLLLAAVANMFTRYMCSSWFNYADPEFRRTVRIFDEIFWEINQGHAIDFLPWLSPFYENHMNRLRTWATDIRSFILEKIVNVRRSRLDPKNEVPRDFTDALLLHLDSPDTSLSWDHVIFELEDFLGGHSAIGNLVMLVLAHVVRHPEVQARIQAECDAARQRRNHRLADLADKPQMPYTEAVMWETLRISSSPIVPHVATRDTEVDGYAISKDTVVFLNNYELNFGEAYWGLGAENFNPERFLAQSKDPERGSWRLIKPAHFLPFSTGQRTCVGQRLVQTFTFATVAAIFSNYNVAAAEGVTSENLKAHLTPGCVALPPDTFHLVLTSRDEQKTLQVSDETCHI
ncbi:cytochrome P450 307a1-like [Neodiprion pinetum]|uniref:cytochrome P450 307a1-like n=1 Tax=Neodiprion pinetum TaxID=441929 RepID=UPI001EDE1BAB|nr:cytochrome P450 307a1-like [Neodiprion pinetum]